MIASNYFADQLIGQGFKFFCGVPCSFLTALTNEVLERDDARYFSASSEGEALAMATGAGLAGELGVVMCQNSGLGNMVNPLTSLNEPFKMPVLLITTWRGEPGIPDEPQHRQMGDITPDLLNLLGIEWMTLPTEPEQIHSVIQQAKSRMLETQKPFALIVQKGVLSPANKKPADKITCTLPTRMSVLSTLTHLIPANAPVIATTGKTGRELFTVADKDQHLYCVGSMGYANALAHGLALSTKQTVFVLDGDGAAIMHLGNFATIGAYGTQNLVHILLDNGTYDSTGGQPTVSTSIDFVALAKAAGYQTMESCQSIDEIPAAFEAFKQPGPHLLHIRIQPGSMKNLGRPTITPDQVAQRLRTFLSEKESTHDQA